jgi:hypothetical protein
VLFADLTRPAVLDDAQWHALEVIIDRVERARRDRDWSQVVGSAKELVEAVAKQILDARGETVSSAAKFNDLVNNAHIAIERQPGEGLAEAGQVRDVAQAAKTIALNVNHLRRDYGTGHGRQVSPVVFEEHADVAVDAALLWCRWALRRLDVVVEGRSVDLLRDLREGTFVTGDLSRRLLAADIPNLSPDEQRRLGLAVGRRASRRTFLVLREGVVAAARDDLYWTDDYRRGVIDGTFIDDDGFVRATGASVGAAVDLLAVVEDPLAVVSGLDEAIATAEQSYAMDDLDRAHAKMALINASDRVPGGEDSQLGVALRMLATRL